jgi:Domain of unknown function (DU1801)
LAKFSPEVRTVARGAIARMRRRLPGAVEFVYDNYNALVMGFGKSERPSDAIFSLVLYPRHVTLCFLEGALLQDPARLLRGDGSRVRHIRLVNASTLDLPAVQQLMDAAVAESGARFDAHQRRKMIVRAVSAKQRARRPV